MEKTDWIVEGMTCSNCALSVRQYLQKEGMKEVSVNPINGKVSFENVAQVSEKTLQSGIASLGYRVAGNQSHANKNPWFNSSKNLFLLTVPFTAILMMHMLHQWIHWHWLTNPLVQFLLCIPVFILGMMHFGKSALKSIANGMANMNVLIALGALVSFIYSLAGWLYYADMQYIYFETTASIITLVFLGNYLEESTMHSTQRALKKLSKSNQIKANMIAFDDQHQEQIFTVDSNALKTGDLVLIKSGEQVPADCKILWGEAMADESLLTGESNPVMKSKKDLLIGGSMVTNGTVKAQVTAAGNDTILSGIVQMVEQAQAHKPPMQQLADKISAIFVPAIVGLSLVVFLVNFYFIHIALDQSIMRAVAVLVISCPCAMGLATPAAISVGLGRAAKKGILYRSADVLESFRHIQQVVFDKTGTLTTGKFEVEKFESQIEAVSFKQLVFSLEKYSTHPIAVSLCKQWHSTQPLIWKKIEEVKGLGMRAEDKEGNIYEIGSYKINHTEKTAVHHDLYVMKNQTMIGWIDITDEIRPEAMEVIHWLHQKNIKTILLTGDIQRKADKVAKSLGIETVMAEQSPADKLLQIEAWSKQGALAMVGDGINDAPALAKATIGISMGAASQLAIHSADVVLLHDNIKFLPEAMGLGRHTYLTIQQNLAWAFAYNIIAIPLAASGFLSPIFSALSMGFSDLMLAAISLNLFIKKVL